MQDTPQILKLGLREKKSSIARRTLNFFKLPEFKRPKSTLKKNARTHPCKKRLRIFSLSTTSKPARAFDLSNFEVVRRAENLKAPPVKGTSEISARAFLYLIKFPIGIERRKQVLISFFDEKRNKNLLALSSTSYKI